MNLTDPSSSITRNKWTASCQCIWLLQIAYSLSPACATFKSEMTSSPLAASVGLNTQKATLTYYILLCFYKREISQSERQKLILHDENENCQNTKLS